MRVRGIWVLAAVYDIKEFSTRGAFEYLRRVSKRAYPVPALVDVPRRKRLDPAKNVTKLREAVSTSKHGGRPDKKAKFFRHFKNHPETAFCSFVTFLQFRDVYESRYRVRPFRNAA